MKRITFVALALASITAHASDYEPSTTTDWKDGFAMVMMDKSETGIDFTRQALSVSIASDTKGDQRLYFKHRTVRDGQFISNCTLGEEFDTEIWKVAGQNVKMTTYCGETEGKDYTTATPATDAGAAFVLKSFKNSAGSVKVVPVAFQQGFKVSAKGFTKAWNNFGGNAI